VTADFETAVRSAENASPGRGAAAALSAAVESALHARASADGAAPDAYGSQAFAVIAALGREGGGALRRRLLGGEIAPATLAGMSSLELATEQDRERRLAQRAAAATPFDRMKQASETDIPCPSCGRREVRALELSSQRDIRKSEVWGGGGSGGSESKRRCLCGACGHSWLDES